MAQAGVLWMGSLEPYMDENFIRGSFNQMGEVISGVKMMKNKFTGEPAGYCFVQFPDDFSALTAMHKLNNKMVPNSQPPVKFRLNHTSLGGKQAMEKDYSLWIGDLSPDVDDYTLYKGFASRYPSVRLAKVILDANGFSKGYGFVRFADEDEQKDALIQMNGFKGIGSKALRVSIAINRAGGQKTSNPLQGQAMAAVQAMWSGQAQPAAATQQDYNQYYEQYWQNYAAWQNYGNYYDPSYSYAQQQPTPQQPPQMMAPAYPAAAPMGIPMPHTAPHVGQQQDDEYELVGLRAYNTINALND